HQGIIDLVLWRAMYNKGTKGVQVFETSPIHFDSRNAQSSSISSPKSMTITGLFPERCSPSSSTTDHGCPAASDRFSNNYSPSWVS
ncbi:hypothetical protein BGW80DRAFT_1276285, partial [Lactifluus volemus]